MSAYSLKYITREQAAAELLIHFSVASDYELETALNSILGTKNLYNYKISEEADALNSSSREDHD